MRRLAVLATLLLLPACGSSSGPAVNVFKGAVTDPVGDVDRPAADIDSVSVEVTDDSVFLSVRWAPGGFSADSSRVTLLLDTDLDPATGAPGINGDGSVDTNLIGAEFLVVLGESPDPVVVRKYTGLSPGGMAVFGWTVVGCCWQDVPNGMDVAMHRNFYFGAIDGPMNVKAVSSIQLSDSTFSRWLDVVPDTGLAAMEVRKQ